MIATAPKMKEDVENGQQLLANSLLLFTDAPCTLLLLKLMFFFCVCVHSFKT